MEEFGLLDFVNQAISDLLSPISSVIFPEWYGSGLDSHKVLYHVTITKLCELDFTPIWLGPSL